MSELELVLQQTEVEVGDPVRGAVRVKGALPENTKSLEVYLVCKGNRLVEKPISQTTLASGQPDASEYPFELPVPLESPFSFRRDEISVDWTVVTHADIPWKANIIEEQAITLLPRKLEGSREVAVLNRDLPVEEKKTDSMLTRAFVYVLYAALWIVLFPLVLIFWIVKKVRESRLKSFDLKLTEPRYAQGQWITANVQFELRGPVEVKSLTVTLTATQRWTTRSGDISVWHNNEFHTEEVTLLENVKISPDTNKGSASSGPSSVYRGRAQSEL